MTTLYTTREEWLTAAIAELRPMFDRYAAAIPQKVRVTCGFPLDAKRSKAIGQCFADANSADKTFEILISPVLDNPLRVFDVLVHELVHSLPGCMNHGVNFQKYCDALHLVPNGAGKQGYKATSAGSAFIDTFGLIIDSLGDYPHAALSYADRKVQRTRMLKAECPSCKYTIRLTQKWASVGLPTCVCGDCFQLTAEA
jgi:hypothetical protein